MSWKVKVFGNQLLWNWNNWNGFPVGKNMKNWQLRNSDDKSNIMVRWWQKQLKNQQSGKLFEIYVLHISTPAKLSLSEQSDLEGTEKKLQKLTSGRNEMKVTFSNKVYYVQFQNSAFSAL